tara:strand:- start:376 stop:579 length:204 start_codon:yes stop_codon:yes gene_type:complete
LWGAFFIGAVKGVNTPRLAMKLKICFQLMPYGLALRWFTGILKGIISLRLALEKFVFRLLIRLNAHP